MVELSAGMVAMVVPRIETEKSQERKKDRERKIEKESGMTLSECNKKEQRGWLVDFIFHIKCSTNINTCKSHIQMNNQIKNEHII